MKEKKISSGAEKVEEIARRNSGRVAQGDAANGGTFISEERIREAEQAAEAAREEARAEKRIAAAEMKRAKKEARAEAKLEQQGERAARAAAEEEERLHRRAARAERKAEKREERERRNDNRAPGFGGWLAAVVSLSVAVLALGAIVTVGYFDLMNTKSELSGGYQSSVYEFSELVENMDANLAKARIADGNYEMQKLLTDVLVQSELAEKCIESFPVEGRETENLTAFFNRTGDYSKSLLHKLAHGGSLTAEEKEVIEYMYSTTEKLRAAMPELIESARLGSIEELFSAEGDFFKNFGTLREPTVEVPKSIEDGPFSQGAKKRESRMLASEQAISESQATERAKELFEGYKPANMRLAGKTENKNFSLYNFEFEDGKGRTYFAQITERGGHLALLDSFEACKNHNYDTESCIRIAEKFLKKCGYEGLKPVWSSEAGTECTVNFACEQDGAVIYPDMIKVKVCEEKGVVTGLEAHSYLVNHTERSIGSASVSMSRVKANAESRMDEVHGVRKALIEADGQELLTYEIAGEFGGRTYYAYIDAKTGETVEIFVVVGTDRGRAIL